MELKIADMLKALRHEQGNKQEDLARHLDISVQAVSKWERGEGMPDITLLPRIAAFYETSVDTLLGCDLIRREQELAEFKKQARVLINQGKRTERLALCRGMQKKYPNDETVLYELMYDLYSVDRKANSEEIIRIAEKLQNSSNSVHRFGAIHLLAFTYNALGDNDKAVEYAKMIETNEDLLVHVLKGDALVDHCRWYFWNACDDLQSHMGALLACKEAGYTAEERHTIRSMMYDFYHMIFGDGDFGFWHDRLCSLRLKMAIDSIESGEIDCAIAELDEMADHAIKFDRFTGIDHTSLLVRGLHYEASLIGRSDEDTMAVSCLKSLASTRFDPIRTDPRFVRITEKLH